MYHIKKPVLDKLEESFRAILNYKLNNRRCKKKVIKFERINNMKRSKDKFYMKQIFDCISDGKIIATGKIAKEIGLSEKSVRNRLNELSDSY